MIGRLPHPAAPEDSTQCVFVPLAYDHESGRWVSLVENDGFFHHDIDAGRVCAQGLGDRFARVAELTQLLRVCCEHPGFEFSGDGIDAEMVRKMARGLSHAVMVAGDCVERLLDEPSGEDLVQMSGMAFKVNEVTCLLEPVADESGQVLDPDGFFVRHLTQGLRRARALTGRAVTQQGIQEAITWLEAMLESGAAERQKETAAMPGAGARG